MSDVKHCKNIRRNIIKSIHKAGSGHYGASLSCVEILYTLYFHVMGPHDKLILSKGHAAPALYATLAEVGLIDEEELDTLRQPNSRLQGHPDRTRLPHLDAGTGALGQGLSISMGYALAAKLDGSDGRVYCIVGDGELQEGQIWEAVMAASKFELNNLCMIIDGNLFQNELTVCETMDLPYLNNTLESFGWSVQFLSHECSIEDLNLWIDLNNWIDGERPRSVFVNTIKGAGISFMEDDNAWHSKQMTDEEYQKALEELR